MRTRVRNVVDGSTVRQVVETCREMRIDVPLPRDATATEELWAGHFRPKSYLERYLVISQCLASPRESDHTPKMVPTLEAERAIKSADAHADTELIAAGVPADAPRTRETVEGWRGPFRRVTAEVWE